MALPTLRAAMVAVSCAAITMAAPAGAAPWTSRASAGYGYSYVSDGTGAWQDRYVRYGLHAGADRGFDLQVLDTVRFGLHDDELRSDGALPLAAGWSLGLDGSFSPTHQVLAWWSAGSSRRSARKGRARAWIGR